MMVQDLSGISSAASSPARRSAGGFSRRGSAARGRLSADRGSRPGSEHSETGFVDPRGRNLSETHPPSGWGSAAQKTTWMIQ